MKNNQWTRRKFLKGLAGGAAGSILLPLGQSCRRDMHLPLPFTGEIRGEEFFHCHQFQKGKGIPENAPLAATVDAAIIGGGPSGLATAWKLKRSGLTNFRILEKEETFGGLCRGAHEYGNTFCFGAHYGDVPEPHQAYLIELYKDLGVVTDIDRRGFPIVCPDYILKPPENNLYVNGEWIANDYPFPLASKTDVAELKRFKSEVLTWSYWRDAAGRRALGPPLTTVSSNPRVRRLDRITMSAYLKERKFTSKLLRWYVNIWLIDEYGTTIDNCSAWCGLDYFRQYDTSSEHQIPGKQISWPMGLGFLTRKMAEQLPIETKMPSCIAVRVENRKTHVRILYYDIVQKAFAAIHARQAVFAVPKVQARYVIPELISAGRTEFESIPYAPWITAVAHLKQLFDFGNGEAAWENTIYDSWTLGYVYNMHQSKSRKNACAITIYACLPHLPARERRELLTYGWEYWARILYEELRIAHPEISGLIRRLDIWKWGHPMRQTTPGCLWGEQTRRMQRPLGRIHFGHADVTGLPVIEEIVHRGILNAEAVMRRLRHPFRSSLDHA